MNHFARSGLCQGSSRPKPTTALGARLFLPVLIAWGLAAATAHGAEALVSGCVLLEKEGKVQVARKGTTAWKAVEVNTVLQNGDQLQTGGRSRATLRWSELSVT